LVSPVRRLGVVDALRIANEEKTRVNTAMLGAITKAAGFIEAQALRDTIANLEAIHRVNDRRRAPNAICSTPDAFFEAILKETDDFPVVRGELQHHAVGCYSVVSEVKRRNRRSETLLLTADKFAVMAQRLRGLRRLRVVVALPGRMSQRSDAGRRARGPDLSLRRLPKILRSRDAGDRRPRGRIAEPVAIVERRPGTGGEMPKPNLVFLFTDEQRQDTLRTYGNTRIQTPNLDALADAGVVFTRAYVSQPVCTPSRATIMTGLYPHTGGCVANNVPLDERVPTLAELFADRDYRFAYLGKWHLGDEIFAQHGFDHWVSIEDGYRSHYRPHRNRNQNCTYYHWLKARGVEPDVRDGEFSAFSRRKSVGLPAELTKPAFLAEETARFIRENAGRPFVAYVNFLEPHMPFTGPYNDRYDPAEIVLPGNFDAPPDPDEPLRCRLLREHYRLHGSEGLDLTSESGWRRLIANYWGLVTLVDEAVGRILRALAENGVADRTIVVFTSDHGDMMGSHRLVAKTVMFEEAVKVPLLLRVPGLAGRRVEVPVSQVDLVPTLLELMGQPIPAALEGYSLKSMLEGPGPPREDHVFIEWNGRDSDGQMKELGPAVTSEVARISGARTRGVISPDGWKLNLSEADKCELYHLPTDPGETENLFYSGWHREVIARLRGRIRRWQERTGDPARV
jgi:arylsulfatase A-like enzyme